MVLRIQTYKRTGGGADAVLAWVIISIRETYQENES